MPDHVWAKLEVLILLFCLPFLYFQFLIYSSFLLSAFLIMTSSAKDDEFDEIMKRLNLSLNPQSNKQSQSALQQANKFNQNMYVEKPIINPDDLRDVIQGEEENDDDDDDDEQEYENHADNDEGDSDSDYFSEDDDETIRREDHLIDEFEEKLRVVEDGGLVSKSSCNNKLV